MQVIRLKHLLSKNSSIEYDRDAKKLSIRRQDKNFSADLTPEWKKAETLWEVIDGVKNLVDACHQIRGYSYEALVLTAPSTTSGTSTGWRSAARPPRSNKLSCALS